MRFKISITIGTLAFLLLTSFFNAYATNTEQVHQQVIKNGKVVTLPINEKVTKTKVKKEKAYKKTKMIRLNKGEQHFNLFWVANDVSMIQKQLNEQNIDGKQIQRGVSYKIQKGDTLSVLSKVTNVPLNKLIYQNQIHDKNLIYEADSLFLQK